MIQAFYKGKIKLSLPWIEYDARHDGLLLESGSSFYPKEPFDDDYGGKTQNFSALPSDDKSMMVWLNEIFPIPDESMSVSTRFPVGTENPCCPCKGPVR